MGDSIYDREKLENESEYVTPIYACLMREEKFDYEDTFDFGSLDEKEFYKNFTENNFQNLDDEKIKGIMQYLTVIECKKLNIQPCKIELRNYDNLKDNEFGYFNPANDTININYPYFGYLKDCNLPVETNVLNQLFMLIDRKRLCDNTVKLAKGNYNNDYEKTLNLVNFMRITTKAFEKKQGIYKPTKISPIEYFQNVDSALDSMKDLYAKEYLPKSQLKGFIANIVSQISEQKVENLSKEIIDDTYVIGLKYGKYFDGSLSRKILSDFRMTNMNQVKNIIELKFEKMKTINFDSEKSK